MVLLLLVVLYGPLVLALLVLFLYGPLVLALLVLFIALIFLVVLDCSRFVFSLKKVEKGEHEKNHMGS